MRFLIYVTLVISLIWGMIAFPDYSVFSALYMDLYTSMWNSIVGVYKYTLPCVTWGLALIYSYDFIMAICNKSTPYMRELYDGTKVELLSLVSLFCFLIALYATTQTKFTNLTIDISMAGFGFIVFGNISIMRLFKFKVGRRKYPRKAALMISLISLLLSYYFLSLTFDIAKGKFNIIQSLWSQITILCFSVSLYFFSKHLNFIMDKGKIEASPTLRALFKGMPPRNGIYEQAALAAELWNKESEKERAVFNSLSRKKKKRKSKK